MSKSINLIGIAVIFLGMLVGSHYMATAAVRHGALATTTAISPAEITQSAGPLPTMVIESYF
jgi:hypothetical protein